MSQKVSLVVPIYNEIKHLEKFLKKIDDLDLKPFKKELVFVDDFSSDGSKELLKKYQFKSDVIVDFQSQNRGKGYCLRLGFSKASGESYCVNMCVGRLSNESLDCMV